MRTIPDALRERFLSDLQTRANNADPRLSAILTRETVPLVNDDFLDAAQIASGLQITGRASLAVRRQAGHLEPDRVYIAYVDDGSIVIRYAELNGKKLNELVWQNAPHNYNGSGRVCIAFNGNSGLATESDPWAFYADDGNLVAEKLGSNTAPQVLVEGNVTAVSAILSRAATPGGPNYGFIVFYIDDGAIFCIRRQGNGWSDPEAVELGPSGVTWADLNAFRTRDARLGVQAITSGNAVYELFTMPAQGDYLLFSSASDFTLGVANATKNWDGRIEYSTDANNWATWDGTTTLSSANKKLMLRGVGNSKICTTNSVNQSFVLTGQSGIRCDGNIDMLLDYIKAGAGRYISIGDKCFIGLFKGCTLLTKAPDLPRMNLSSSCYMQMFHGCTSLTSAPALPATSLQFNCYDGMFSGCTSLTAAPELPATTLLNGCYAQMFFGCTSLTAAPELPAAIIPSSCYKQMFLGCTSLTAAPELPATTLYTSCYEGMFKGCTSLTAAPALPATSLVYADKCYKSMFYGCTSLTAAPELPATTLYTSCYEEMFSSCTSLTTPPALPATTLTPNCYKGMFSGCTSLTTLPALPATTLASYCYMGMFSGCRSLTRFPSLPVLSLPTDCYQEMFSYSSLKLSDHEHDEFMYPYRIPTSGTGEGSFRTVDMFKNYRPNEVPTPEINTVYYGNYPTAE